MTLMHLIFVHNLDVVAALFTGTSTVLLACHKRIGFIPLLIGSLVWFCVALMATFAGRPIWAQAVMSLWTCGWAIYGWRAWGRKIA